MCIRDRYWNILAYNRNIHMKDTLADSIHNNKHDFIGVGCKHLYGKKGIIQLLKDDGYLVAVSYTHLDSQLWNVKKQLIKLKKVTK